MAEKTINSFNVDGTEYDIEDTAGRARAEEAYKLSYGVDKLVNEPEPEWVSHRNIYRGKNLGNVFTQDQLKHIKDGTFEDLYVGDYWKVPGQDYEWQIADINYWTRTGTTETRDIGNHIVICPTDSIAYDKMYDTNIVTEGYVGSNIYINALPSCLNSLIYPFFGKENIKSHEQAFSNKYDAQKNSLGFMIDDAIAEIPDLVAFIGYIDTGEAPTIGLNFSSHNPGQLSLMRLNTDSIFVKSHAVSGKTNNVWTRNIISKTGFVCVNRYGILTAGSSSSDYGIRPIFAVG